MLRERYEALGGQVEMMMKAGVGRHPHSLADLAPIAGCLLRHRLK